MPTATGCARAILEAAAGHTLTSAGLRAAISGRDLGARARAGRGGHHPSVRLAGAGGRGREDVSRWWTHVVSLHRKSRTLHKELKDAELALGSEPSEENLAWLRDIQARLAALRAPRP